MNNTQYIERLQNLMVKAHNLFKFQITRGISEYNTSKRFTKLFTKYVEFRKQIPKARFWYYAGMSYAHHLNIEIHDKRRS